MKDDFIVPLDGLAQGRTEFRRSVGKEFFEHFENSEILDASLGVSVIIDKSGRYIGIDCDIEGYVTVTCDRCLGDLRLPVDTGFFLDVRFGEPDPVSGEGPDEDPESGRETVYLPLASSEMDLAQAVYDYVCLSLPVQRVHEEGGCDPETVRYLNSEDGQEPVRKDSSTPFAGLKDLLGKIE